MKWSTIDRFSRYDLEVFESGEVSIRVRSRDYSDFSFLMESKAARAMACAIVSGKPEKEK